MRRREPGYEQRGLWETSFWLLGGAAALALVLATFVVSESTSNNDQAVAELAETASSLAGEEVPVKPKFASGEMRSRLKQKQRVAKRAAQTMGSDLDADLNGAGGFASWFYAQRALPGDRIPPNARADALRSAEPLSSRRAPGPDYTWRALGPTTIPRGQTDVPGGLTFPTPPEVPLSNVSGRLQDIAVHPQDPNTVYAGGAQGGVWKTTNALSDAPVWVPLTDDQPSLAIGAIAIDPVNPDIIYVGTGEPAFSCDSYYGQGLLRSDDGGATWTHLPGFFSNLAIADLQIDPTTAGTTSETRIWAGVTVGFLSSGTANCELAPAGFLGGLFVSNDSGATWGLADVPTGAGGNELVSDIVLDPGEPDRMYVGIRSLTSASNSGVWRTSNATAPVPVFEKAASGYPDTALSSPTQQRISLAIGGEEAASTLYAAIQASNANLYAVYKTTDGGDNWSHVDGGANGTCDVSAGGFAVDRKTGFGGAFPSGTGIRILVDGRISRTVALVDSGDLLFAVPPFSEDLTDVPCSIAAYPSFCDGQCWYDMTIGADPTDPNADTVYVGGNPNFFFADLAGDFGQHSLWRSDDGGSTWGGVSQGDGVSGGIHVDDHALVFDASMTPARLWNGNDGGIWRTENQGASWSDMNTNIAITQFQGVSQHPTDREIILGGTQDNGTNIRNPALVDPNAWFHTDFGDGGRSLIDQSDPDSMYHTYFNQSFSFMGPARSDIGGAGGPGTWGFTGAYYGYGAVYYNGMDPTDPVSFYAPLAQHRAYDPNVIYFGSNKVYRAQDPEITCCPAPVEPSWNPVSPALTSGFISAIGVNQFLYQGKEVVYTGGSDGLIARSTDVDDSVSGCPGACSNTWEIINDEILPPRFVTDIAVDPADRKSKFVYVTYSGFNSTTPLTPGHVFMTRNGHSGGPTVWHDISGNLPDVPVNAIAVQMYTQKERWLYVGTDIGVFRSIDNGASWVHLNDGHPNVSVFDLDFNLHTSQLVSATHGRGMFELVQDSLLSSRLVESGFEELDVFVWDGL